MKKRIILGLAFVMYTAVMFYDGYIVGELDAIIRGGEPSKFTNWLLDR